MTNLFEMPAGKLNQLIGVLAKNGLSAELANMIRKDPALAKIGFEAIESYIRRDPALERCVVEAVEKARVKRDRILLKVPKLSASVLLEQAKDKLKIIPSSHVEEAELAVYKFMHGEGGKTYESMTWFPGRRVKNEEVCQFFFRHEFEGNSAVFVAWIMEHDPEGYFYSVPPKDSRVFRYFRDEHFRTLDIWSDGYDDNATFVGFREVK